MAAKGKYQKEFPGLVEQMRGNGLTDKAIYENLGIEHTAFYDWLRPDSVRYKKDFSEAYARGSKIICNDIKSEMVKRAKGYDYEETQTIYMPDKQGKPSIKETKKTKKHIPGDTTAMNMYLKNNDSEWRDKQEIQHSGEINTSTGLEGKTLEELLQLAEKLKD